MEGPGTLPAIKYSLCLQYGTWLERKRRRRDPCKNNSGKMKKDWEKEGDVRNNQASQARWGQGRLGRATNYEKLQILLLPACFAWVWGLKIFHPCLKRPEGKEYLKTG